METLISFCSGQILENDYLQQDNIDLDWGAAVF